MIMIVLALLFLQLIFTAECTPSCWGKNKTCSCCRTGECIKSGNKSYCTDCIDGLTGDTCEEPCPPNCINCSQIFFPSNRTCFSCRNGYYNGRPYDKLVYHVENDCSRSCMNGCAVCESYKACTKCKINFYMDSTSNKCIECPKNCPNCSSATNNREGCKKCLPNCQRCDSYGSCQECDHGFFWEEKYCKSCIDVNYTNEACFKESVPPDIPMTSSSKANTGLIVGLVIGSVVIIFVCGLVVIIVRRRCYQSRSRTQVTMRTPAANDDENIELLSQEASRTTETREFSSAEKLTVLQESIDTIEKKYGNMKVTVAGNKVTIEGVRDDIEKALKEIDIKCGEIKRAVYKHSKSREWLNFCQKRQTVEYVQQKLKQKQFLGTWNINNEELIVFVSSGSCENFKNILLESVSEISAKIDKSLLSSEWWGEFLLDIRVKFKEKVHIFTKEQQDVVIICTDDAVQQVTQMVGEFLESTTDAIWCMPGVCEFVTKYWSQDDFDDIRKTGVVIKTEANGFKLRGQLENLINGKEMLNMKLRDICSKQQVLTRTGIITVLEAAKQSGTISDIEMDLRCVMKLQQDIGERPSIMLHNFEVIDSQLLKEKQQESCTICFQTRRHMIKIQLIQGTIVHQTADIIVVGAASSHDLQSGSAFISLLEQGGPNLKTDYNRRYPNGIQNGEVAVIDSGNLKCDKIYLTSLPPWKEASHNGGKVLKNFMRECLRLADRFDKKTISFNSMVTGVYLGYPIDLAVSIVYGTIAEFDNSYGKTSLKEINIVEDDETFKTYLMYHLKKQARENRTKRIFIEDGTILTKLYEDPKYRMVKDGCVIGPIQLQVQIGDLLNCTTDVIVVEFCDNIDSKDNVLHNYGVLIKENAEIKAEHVIDVLLEDTLVGWRSKLVRCLEEAGKKDVKSVALPVFGSGTGTKAFSSDGIGACLFAAIDDFTSQNPKSSVTDVRLVVPDSNAGCVPAIIAALQDRTTAVNSQWGISKIFKSQLGFSKHTLKESFVTVYSDETINIDRCFAALIDRIRMEFAEKIVEVDNDVIRSLKDKQINSIIDSDIVADVMFNKTAGHFTISGPLLNVLAAVNYLQNKMKQYRRKENNRKSAKVLYDQTKWNWLCENQVSSEKEIPYDMMTNFIIETAYKEGKQTAELQSKDGKIHVIDFHKRVEYPKFNMYDTVMVIRKDFLKELQYGSEISLSKSWTSMIKYEKVKRVEMEYGTEYQKVKKLFLEETMNYLYSSKENSQSVQVVKIERIQNKTLYQQYKAKKKMLKLQKPGCKQTERRLWHETAEERVRWIINNGFNRSYCGVHEVEFGQGVYFAADASYSAQSFLAGNKPGAKRYMFLSKVLTGELIKGNPSMRVLPLVDPAYPKVMYDTAVNDVNYPMQFVIFHDKQAYPKYLITYTSEVL